MQVSIFDGSQDFRFKKPIRLIECFAGYGSQALALKELGVGFQHWRICEWAVKSIQAYKDNHFHDVERDYAKEFTFDEIVDILTNLGISANYSEPMSKEQIKRLGEKECRKIYNNIKNTNNLVNISSVKGKDLEIKDTDKCDYILTYSFPCFTADSLVLSKDGYKRICDIDYGDFVLSHDNKYHKVTNVFNNGTHDIYKINAMGVDEIKTTLNHKFYVREKFHKGHKWTRSFKDPTWEEICYGLNYNISFTTPKHQKVEMIICDDYIDIVSLYQSIVDFSKPLTYENYILACKRCKELFLGDEY